MNPQKTLVKTPPVLVSTSQTIVILVPELATGPACRRAGGQPWAMHMHRADTMSCAHVIAEQPAGGSASTGPIFRLHVWILATSRAPELRTPDLEAVATDSCSQ